MVKSLLTFLVEVIVTAIVLGYLVNTYPDAFKPLIPFLVLGVLIHATWNLCRADRIRSFVARSSIWQNRSVLVRAMVVVVAVALMGIYWYGINAAIAGLARIQSRSDALKPRTAQPHPSLNVHAQYDDFLHSGREGSGYEWSKDDVAVNLQLINTGDDPLENLEATIALPDDMSIANIVEETKHPDTLAALPSPPGPKILLGGVVDETNGPSYTISNSATLRCKFLDKGQGLMVRMATKNSSGVLGASRPGRVFPAWVSFVGRADVRSASGLQRVDFPRTAYATKNSRTP